MPKPTRLKVITARKEQVCQICGGTIEPGQHYHRFTVGRANVKVCQKPHPVKIEKSPIRRDD